MELDHIALIVSKEENLAFYEQLGFIEKNRIERGYDTVVFLSCGDVVLEVFVFFQKRIFCLCIFRLSRRACNLHVCIDGNLLQLI